MWTGETDGRKDRGIAERKGIEGKSFEYSDFHNNRTPLKAAKKGCQFRGIIPLKICVFMASAI